MIPPHLKSVATLPYEMLISEAAFWSIYRYCD